MQIVAAPGAAACLYGGRRVQGRQKDGEKFYAADLPGVREGTWDFRTLIVNGRYCPRARLPKQGYFEHLSVFDVPWMTTSAAPAPGHNTIYFVLTAPMGLGTQIVAGRVWAARHPPGQGRVEHDSETGCMNGVGVWQT